MKRREQKMESLAKNLTNPKMKEIRGERVKALGESPQWTQKWKEFRRKKMKAWEKALQRPKKWKNSKADGRVAKKNFKPKMEVFQA